MTDQPTLDDETLDDPTAAADPAGAVREPTVSGLPDGYRYGVTRYADVILEQAFPQQWEDLLEVLDEFRIGVSELQEGGGGRTKFVARFDQSLNDLGWGKKNISIDKLIDGRPISKVRSHEIDMFAPASEDEDYPGIACEMEWNNKDPFYDRDLLNFQALHREGALAVGIIVTRGPLLQPMLERTILHEGERTSKYGKSSTHWDKLVPRVNLGGGGECPLLLVGIERERIDGREDLEKAMELMEAADEFKANWRAAYDRWKDAKPEHDRMLDEAYGLVGR